MNKFILILLIVVSSSKFIIDESILDIDWGKYTIAVGKFLLLRNASDLYNWIKQRGYLKKIINIFKEYGIYGKPVVVQWCESNVGKDKYCLEFMDYIYELTMK